MKLGVDKDGNLVLPLDEIFEKMTDEAKREAAKILAFSPVLMGAVLDCVVSGVMFQDDTRGAWWFGEREIQELREKLIPLMEGFARETVRGALVQRNAAQAAERRAEIRAHRLFHAWPEGFEHLRPSPIDEPRVVRAEVQESEVETVLRGEAGVPSGRSSAT
jgi:hypothetical protein